LTPNGGNLVACAQTCCAKPK